ncbi:MAG TPA: archaellin/type IV pilin N-terminal domain-containing protein [archaeon]|nr:archaellin/type IV pilin N-terminal domain-containing protein [archaeon]HLD81507.1 archaellin/type IV pilin N-terminal domain-containing protein [archaeon]
MLNQRGFSPVIAVVLMVAVAVAAAVIAYLWGIGLLSGIIAGSDTGQITGTAAISIEAINADENRIFVRCKGDATTVTDIYVTTSPGTIKRVGVLSGSSESCTAGSNSLLDINMGLGSGSSDTDANFDLNVGFVVRIVGTNNAEAIKTV